MKQQTMLEFLGTSSCRADLGNDTASFVIDRRLMVDTGWCGVENLRSMGIDPVDVPYLMLTHLHHDHYLSLPSLLFYHLGLKGDLSHLTVLGPCEDVERVLRLTADFLQMERFYPDAALPKVVPLSPGEVFETPDFRLETAASLHPVQGLCCKYVDKQNGITVGFSGDTAYQPALGVFFAGSDILLHECSLGPIEADPVQNARYLHSGALDAARVAREADVPHLVLMHGTTVERPECIKAAQTVFGGRITWPDRGCSYVLMKP